MLRKHLNLSFPVGWLIHCKSFINFLVECWMFLLYKETSIHNVIVLRKIKILGLVL